MSSSQCKPHHHIRYILYVSRVVRRYKTQHNKHIPRWVSWRKARYLSIPEIYLYSGRLYSHWKCSHGTPLYFIIKMLGCCLRFGNRMKHANISNIKYSMCTNGREEDTLLCAPRKWIVMPVAPFIVAAVAAHFAGIAIPATYILIIHRVGPWAPVEWSRNICLHQHKFDANISLN